LAWLAEPVALSGHDADIGVGRMSLWWAVSRSLVIGTRPTRCVSPSLIEETTMITDKPMRGIDPAGFDQAFLQDGIATLQNLDIQGWVAGSDANVFVSNHDTERV